MASPEQRSPRVRLGRAARIGLLVAVVVGLLPTAGATAASGYAVDLLRKGDFVGQTTPYQCIGASIQMTLNIAGARDDRTAATQARVQQMARELSWTSADPTRPFRGEPRGASSRGWARALNRLGVGWFMLRSEATLEEAVRTAAVAIRRTGLPVGLLVQEGRHAWLMTGFRATADPSTGGPWEVQSVSVVDPWYPRTNGRWGVAPKPGARMTLGQLADDFVRLSFRRSGHGGRFLLVLPLAMPPQPASDRIG
jgi:hypothetical protein